MADNNKNNSVKTVEKPSKKVADVLKAQGANIAKANSAPRSIPFYKGQELTFVLDTLKILYHASDNTTGVKEWSGILAADGTEVSVNQLVRRGNGLDVSRNTVKESVEAFLMKIDNKGGSLKIRISEVRTRELIQSDGSHSQQTVLLFEEVA